MGIIYKLTSPEGKSYIGQTIQTFNKRMSGHVHGKSYCRALKDAIEKYGFDTFQKQIIWEGDNDLISEKENITSTILTLFIQTVIIYLLVAEEVNIEALKQLN